MTFEKLDNNVDRKEKINIIKKNELKKNLDLYQRIEKKIKFVEYVIFKRRMKIIILLYSHAIVMAH